MITHTIADFFAQLLPKGRLLGLDVGDKTVGLAISDERRVIASAMETLRRKKFTQDAETLKALIAEHKVAGLVIGLPLMPDGREGERCQSVRQFARNLEKVWTFPLPLKGEGRGGSDTGTKSHPHPNPPPKGGGNTLPIFFQDERFSTGIVEDVLKSAEMSHKKRGEVVDKMAAAYILQSALDRLAKP